MGKAFIVARKDIRETFHTKAVYFYMILLCLLCLPYFDGANSVINSLLEQGLASDELKLAIQDFLNGALETLPLVLTMLLCSLFSAYAIIMEKTKRTIESLFATPLTLRQIWLGKSLAVAVPGIAIALLVSLLTLLAMNLVIVTPAAGSLIMPSALSLLTGLVIVPAMAFFVVSLVSFLQLMMSNPGIANFAFIGIFLLIYLLTITEALPSWNLAFVYLVATVLLAATTLFLTRFLTKERVILTSKG